MAIMMGRMVCLTSAWAAFVRDTKFRLARILGKLPDGPAAYPPISVGAILSGSKGAGSYFPQPVSADGNRLDDQLGVGSWLIARRDLARPDLSAFAGDLTRWLDKHEAEAVLVRPDRYVFGTGSPEQLTSAWHAVAGRNASMWTG